MSKAIISTFFIYLSTFAYSQIEVSAKANILFPTESASWRNITESALDAYESGGKKNEGFNLGLALKIGLLSKLFIQPEVYYSSLYSEFKDNVTETTLKANNSQIDVPLLIGYDLFGEFVGVFSGPVASYRLKTENQFNDFKENSIHQYKVGYQFGVQVTLKKMIITGRYEGAFKEDQRDYINLLTNQIIRYDNRANKFIAGIGYKF